MQIRDIIKMVLLMRIDLKLLNRNGYFKGRTLFNLWLYSDLTTKLPYNHLGYRQAKAHPSLIDVLRPWNIPKESK